MRILPALFLILSSICSAQISVLYGEFPETKYSSSICIDKNGSIYPDVIIPNSLLLQNDNSLFSLFKNSSTEFRKISEFYGCTFENFNELNFSTLQDSILKRKAYSLKKHSKDKNITFLIHGFRKPFFDTLYDWSSQRDFIEMKKSLESPSSYFVEVYWDGQYGCCFSKDIKRNKELFRSFENAQKYAIQTGLGLGKILSRLSDKNINIVTHSLGARVALYSLSAASEIKNLRVLMVAPAIGKNEFIQQTSTLSKTSAIRFSIAYNHHDFVLRKKDNHLMLLGPGARKYGETGLGCNHRGGDKKGKQKVIYTKSRLTYLP